MTNHKELPKLAALFLLAYVPDDKRDAASDSLAFLVKLAMVTGMTEDAQKTA